MKKKLKKKQIVFIESNTTAYTLKLARALRKAGYYTILIRILKGSNEKYLKLSFDEIISFNAKFIKLNLKNSLRILFYLFLKSPNIFRNLISIYKLRPYVVIGKAPPNWICVLFKHIFRSYPFIYFPYDIRSFGFSNLGEAKRKGIPKFELRAEGYLFKNADGIIHKGDENELRYLDEKIIGKFRIASPVLHFPPYCSREFIVPINENKLSKKDRKIHLVFVGHLVTNSETKENSWEEPIQEILNQKIHLHLYGKTMTLTDEEVQKRVEKSYLLKFLSNKYFHLHSPKDPKELIKEISKYDFGIWLGYCYEKRPSIKFASGNKMSSYLEAGIPFIYYENHEFIDKLMKNFGLRLAIKPEDTKNLKKILKKINYSSYKKKVEKARRDFELEKNLPRFEKFIREVHKQKYKNLNFNTLR